MGLIEKYIEGNESRWIWFITTLFGGFIPLILRFFISLGIPINPFDFKDILFAGLAMNLSNLNIFGNKNFKTSVVIAVISGAFMISISCFLGVFLCKESTNLQSSMIWLKCISGVFVAISIKINYEAHNYFSKTIHI